MKEEWLWGVGLLLVALVVVAINDKTKKKPSKPKESKPGSILGLCLGIFAVAWVFFLVTPWGQKVPPLLGWIAPFILLGFVIIFLLRKDIWLLLKILVSGQLVLKPKKNKSGHLVTKCPTCSQEIELTEFSQGETAFQCPQCGTKGSWDSIP